MINKRLPLRGRLILFITRTITERIGLHSVLLPLSITLAPDVRSQNTKDKITVPLPIARFDRKERKKEKTLIPTRGSPLLVGHI